MSKIYFSKILHGCEKIIQVVQGYKSLYPIPNPQSVFLFRGNHITTVIYPSQDSRCLYKYAVLQVSLFLFLTNTVSHHTYCPVPFFLFTNGISVINDLLHFLKELLCSLVWLCLFKQSPAKEHLACFSSYAINNNNAVTFILPRSL